MASDNFLKEHKYWNNRDQVISGQCFIYYPLERGHSFKYVRKISEKLTCVCVSGGKKGYSVEAFCVRTKWIAPNGILARNGLRKTRIHNPTQGIN